MKLLKRVLCTFFEVFLRESLLAISQEYNVRQGYFFIKYDVGFEH